LGSPSGRVESPKAKGFVTDDDRQLLTWVSELVFAAWSPAPLAISKPSSTGIPTFTRDPIAKVAKFRKARAVWRDWVAAARSNNRATLERLGADHDMVLCYAIARRMQVDKVTREGNHFSTKEREVFDHRGVRRVADKSTEWPDFFTKRDRLAYAFPGDFNYLIAAVFACFRWVMSDRFSFTWKHTIPQIMVQKINRFALGFSIDVKNFDQNQRLFMIDEVWRAAPAFNDDFRLLLHLAARAPSLVTNDYIGGRGHRILGDVFDVNSFVNEYGNPSGWAPNDMVNKVIGAWLMLIIFRDLGIVRFRTREDVAGFLRGDHPSAGLLNMGDDNVPLLARKEDLAAMHRYVADDAHPYFSLEVESGMKFLGRVFARAGDQVLSLPNLNSYVYNFLNPERGFDSPHRPEAAFGYDVRKLNYMDHPSFRFIDEAVNATWRSTFGETLDNVVARHQRKAPQRAGISAADLVFITNPDSIHYKLEAKQVDPALLDLVYATIDEREVGVTVAQCLTIPPERMM